MADSAATGQPVPSLQPSSSLSTTNTAPSSSSSSPALVSSSVVDPPPPKIRIKLTQNGSSFSSAANLVKPAITSIPTTVQQATRTPLSQEMQNGTNSERFSESLSPPPEGSLSGAGDEDSLDDGNSSSSNFSSSSSKRQLGNSSNGGGGGGGREQKENTSPSKPARKRRAEQVFICSRDYAPLPAETQTDPHSEVFGKRTERIDRKSKTETTPSTAMSASTMSDGTSNGVSDGPPNPSMHPLRKILARQSVEQTLPPLPFDTRPPTLDSTTTQGQFPSIPTHHSTPREIPPRTRPRLYELEEAPTFYPTREEFADPLRYIQYVGDPKGGNGKAYGIVKIVPPKGWNPEFVLNQDRFRFRTRMQRLNSLSADARASLNYLEQLQKFHAQQGYARVSIPVVDRRALDLYNLKLTVGSFGGYESINKSRKWAEVTRKLGYEESLAAHLATQIKAAYTRIILPFEKFLIANRDSMKKEGVEGKRRTTSPEHQPLASASPSSSRGTMTAAATATATTSSNQTQPASPFLDEMDIDRSVDDSDGHKRRSSRKRVDPSKATPTGLSFRSNKRNTSPNGDDKLIVVPGAEEQMCEICLRGDNGTSMLLCDECNRGYHMYCLDPPLNSIPKSQWFCPPCLVGTGNDYGFEDGERHSLYSFWNRAESFRSAWFKQRPNHIWKSPPELEGKPNGLTRPIANSNLKVSEDDVEREFWRLIHSPDETVEVEYGADIHSTTHGSASPTVETHPLSPYARDGWNLNNLPILPGSLLRYIKSDISGMTVPWIYVGMIFSTFCWHNEDHFTYSINYHHFGDTKTWYGVPGSDAEKLEEAIRAVAPDLFEQSPDLLFQLVTMMSPEKLKKHGVKVYACDQRANEFVITYPKAYHAGFNHGFNLNEAVNFAPPDWMDLGLEQVRRYQEYKQFPVFSHDELVVTVFQHNQSVDTAMWLQSSMNEMVKREIEKRNELRRLVPNILEVVEEDDKPESQYQCSYCRIFCYLGQIVSEKAEGVACLDHGNEVCGIDSPTKWALRTRFSDETLTTMLAKTVERAAIPTMWKSRLHKLIAASPTPNLRNLRGLLHEGEKIPFEMEEVDQLRDFVQKANRWVDEATNFIARKHQKRSGVMKESAVISTRKVKRGSTKGSATTVEEDEAGEQEEPGEQERVYELLEEAQTLPFDAPEIAALKGVVSSMEEFKARAKEILYNARRNQMAEITECEEVLSLGNSLNVKFEELDELQKYVGKRKWIKEVMEIEESFSNMTEVESYIEEARVLEIPSSHPLLIMLTERREAGAQWQKKAEAILGIQGEPNKGDKFSTNFRADDVEQLLKATYKVPIVIELHVRLEGLSKHVKEWTRQCDMLINAETIDSNDELGITKRYTETCRILKHLEESNVVIKHEKGLMKMKSKYEAWERLVWERLFGVEKWEPGMAIELVSRVKREYLEKAMDCCNSQDDNAANEKNLPCICRSEKKEKGAKLQCSNCEVNFHISCLDLDKKEVKEKDWQCAFCKPSKLSNLFNRQAKKPSVKKMKVMLKEYEASGASSQPWGQSPTHRTLVKTVVSVSHLAALALPPHHEPSKGRIEETIHLLKKMLYCPLRIKTKDGLEDVTVGYIEAVVAHAQRAHNSEGSSKDASTVAWKDIHLGPIPPFRSAPTTNTTTTKVTSTHAGPSRGGAEEERVNHMGEDSLRDVTMNTTADFTDEEGGTGSRAEGSTAKPRSGAGNEDRKRKRGKRAKFVFEEEVGIFVPVHGERVYCLCHKPETGTMISCERCSLWFHNTCVHITAETDLGEERWICPMCCVKTERKYPFAEVKVKEMGVVDPKLWLDVRATLRSTKGPVSKPQHWTSEPDKRIELHLESFYPATLPTAQESNKRPRLNEGSPGAGRHVRAESNGSGSDALPHNPNALGSVAKSSTWNDVKARVTPAHRTPLMEEKLRMREYQAQERHRAGMKNLYDRGVTDAMIQKWYVGWNGRDLVYPRKDRFGAFHELILGSRITLAADDHDGTRLITTLLQQEEDEKLRKMPMPMDLPSSPPSGKSSQSKDIYGERKDLGKSRSSPVLKPKPIPILKSSLNPPSRPNHQGPPLPSLPRSSGIPPAGSVPPSSSRPVPMWGSELNQYGSTSQHHHYPRLSSLAAPSHSSYRSSSATIPPPPSLPPFTSRSPSATHEVRNSGNNSFGPSRSPATLPASLGSPALRSIPPIRRPSPSMNSSASGAVGPQTMPPSAAGAQPPPPPPSAAAAGPGQHRPSPRSSPYFTSRTLAQSRESTPRSSNVLQSPVPTPRSPTPLSHQSPRSQRVESKTPEKTIEDYRLLARKMKPNATEEEVESMARYAMS